MSLEIHILRTHSDNRQEHIQTHATQKKKSKKRNGKGAILILLPGIHLLYLQHTCIHINTCYYCRSLVLYAFYMFINTCYYCRSLVLHTLYMFINT